MSIPAVTPLVRDAGDAKHNERIAVGIDVDWCCHVVPLRAASRRIAIGKARTRKTMPTGLIPDSLLEGFFTGSDARANDV